jgi:hypothetical protein
LDHGQLFLGRTAPSVFHASLSVAERGGLRVRLPRIPVIAAASKLCSGI